MSRNPFIASDEQKMVSALGVADHAHNKAIELFTEFHLAIGARDMRRAQIILGEARKSIDAANHWLGYAADIAKTLAAVHPAAIEAEITATVERMEGRGA